MKLNKLSSLVSLALVVSAAGFSSSAFADASAPAAGNATANLDFQIVIPRVLSFRVGTNVAGTVDQIQFNPAAAVVGNSVAQAGTGGDLGAGAVTASVRGNNGQVTITAATLGALNNGAAGTIPWTQITTTATAGALPALLPAPVIPLTGTGAAVNAPLVVNATNADARWTYGYLNTVLPSPGTYGGVNIRNSRVTYTATMP